MNHYQIPQYKVKIVKISKNTLTVLKNEFNREQKAKQNAEYDIFFSFFVFHSSKTILTGDGILEFYLLEKMMRICFSLFICFLPLTYLEKQRLFQYKFCRGCQYNIICYDGNAHLRMQ